MRARSCYLSGMWIRPDPQVEKIALDQTPRSIICMGRVFYVLLDKPGNTIHAVKFRWQLLKTSESYDVAQGRHPLSPYGLDGCGVFEVRYSPWVDEYRTWNQNGPLYNEYGFEGRHGLKHYVVCTLNEVVEFITNEPLQEVSLADSVQIADLNGLFGCL